jgi:hypothetical protein
MAQFRYDVGTAGCEAQARNIQVSFVGGSHDSAVWVSNSDWIFGGLLVEDQAIKANIATGSSGVGYKWVTSWLFRCLVG